MKKVMLGFGILVGVLGLCVYKKYKTCEKDKMFILLDDGYKVNSKYLTSKKIKSSI